MTALRYIVLIAAGCNGVYGLGGVSLQDATFFDGAPRNPVCPPVGTAAPSFDRELHQVLGAGNCGAYAVARDGTAMAVCGVMTTQVWAAEPGGALAAVTLSQSYPYVEDARIAGDGSFAIVRALDAASAQQTFVIHHVAGAWTGQDTIPISSTAGILNPSAGPSYHVIYFDTDPVDGHSLFEIVGDGSTWMPHDHYSIMAALGIDLDRGALSPDGLHLVGSAFVSPNYVVVYADRATLTDRFTAARVVTTAPVGIYDPYLTDNCDRLYFSALDRVFDVRQP